MIHQDFFRNTGTLLAEHDVVIRTEICFAVETLRLGRGIPQTRRTAASGCRACLQERTVFFTACFFFRLFFCVNLCLGIRAPEVFQHEVFVIPVSVHIQLGPVVQAGAAKFFFRDFKSQGLDQVQRRVGRRTAAAYISCISGDLRFVQYNVHFYFSSLSLATNLESLVSAFLRLSME